MYIAPYIVTYIKVISLRPIMNECYANEKRALAVAKTPFQIVRIVSELFGVRPQCHGSAANAALYRVRWNDHFCTSAPSTILNDRA